MINKIKDLSGIHINSHLGLHKKWIYTDKNGHTMCCNCLEKIKLSVIDLNNEIDNIETANAKSIIYIIALVTWISESFNIIRTLLKKEVIDGFQYAKQDELNDAFHYMKAIRSFILAHPFGTDKHNKFGFDGNYICSDIISKKCHDMYWRFDSLITRKIDINGIHDADENSDFYLIAYSDKDYNNKFFIHIGCSFSDIFRVAELYIDKLYALDRYLAKLNKADYEVRK